MFCGNCGQQLKDDAKFCHGCGAVVGEANDAGMNGFGANDDFGFGGSKGTDMGGGNSGPKRVRKKKSQKKNLIWIPIVAAAAVLVLVVGILAVSLLGGDAAKLMKAVTKSANAYSEAYDKLNMPDLSYIAETKAYSGSMAVTIDEVDGSSEMAGIGARMTMDVNLDKREIGVSATPYFGAADLMTAYMKVDNDKVYLGIPELTGETFYMINTQTLGKDLNNLGADTPELEEFGFNLFDLVQQMENITKQNEKVTEEMKKAVMEFAKTIEVEKTGTEEIEVNDEDLKCTVYDVLISEDAMNDLVDAIEDNYDSINNIDAYLAIYESMGLPEEAIEELEYELEYSMDGYDEMFDELRDALDYLGDVELQVYINGGYVVAVVYDEKIDGTSVEIVLNLGGGKNYVDDLSLTISIDGTDLIMTSNGNHCLDGGEFNDKTVVRMKEDGYSYTALTMKTTYVPKDKEDNFEFEIESEDFGMEARGQITGGSDSLSMVLDEVSISEYGYDMMTIGLEYQIGKYKASTINTRNSVALGSLTEDELMEEAEKIEENATEWAEKLMDEYPELMYYFY